MKKTVAAILAAAAMAAFGENLVSEEHRAFEVPFKGEGQMGMKFIPVFFPRGTEGHDDNPFPVPCARPGRARI